MCVSAPPQEWLRKRGAPQLVAGHSNMLAARPRPERRFGCWTPVRTSFWLLDPGATVARPSRPSRDRRATVATVARRSRDRRSKSATNPRISCKKYT
eukprot:gene13343-biopygen15575